MVIGIDKIGLNISNKYIDISELAIARNIEVEKYTKGIGQIQMSITDISQDIVTLGLLAAKDILTEEDKEKIDLVILATESSVDESKASSIYIKNFLGINDYCKCIEIKQACFGATAALDFAKAHISMKKDKKVLVIASDIAKYGINTAGEVTQGAGSIALLISKEPSIAEFRNDEIAYSDDIMDFWRPNYSSVAFVDGKFSVEKYLEILNKVWTKFENKEDLSAICLHVPYTKLAYKGLNTIVDNEEILKEFENATMYNKRVGNIYTGSLYLSFLSLILHSEKLKDGDNIGMYSYGSGAVAEFFSLKLAKEYRSKLNKKYFDDKLDSREKISIKDYEKIFFEKLELENGNVTIEYNRGQEFALVGIENNKRVYKYVER